MSLNNKLAWEEGMFLSPAHFQQHDRYLENLINQKTTRVSSHMWGVKSLKLDAELLALGKLGLIDCSGIMIDGTVFELPCEDSLPSPLVISDVVINKHVYLGVAIKQAGLQDTNPNANTKDKRYRYFIDNREIADNIVGNDEKVEVPLAKLTLHLFLEGEDLSNYTCIPIAFIKEAHFNQKITLDENFIPPCLSTYAIPRLTKITQEIRSLLHHRGEMLSHRLTQEQHSQTAMILDFMLLQLINRYEPYFTYLANEKTLHPSVLYEKMLQLMGELATFTQASRRPEIPDFYDHYDITNSFQPILEYLRQSLSMVIEQHTTAIPLIERQHGVWVAEVENKEIFTSNSLVLAVYADVTAETIRMNFPKQAKVAPVEQLQQLITRQLPGIELQLMPTAPRQIPFHANYTYFTLNKNHESWQYLEKSAALAIYLGASYPNPKLELWAIKG